MEEIASGAAYEGRADLGNTSRDERRFEGVPDPTDRSATVNGRTADVIRIVRL